MNLIKLKFIDSENQPKGRDYTYIALEEFKIGDFVQIDETKRGIVTEVNIPITEVEAFKDRLKEVKCHLERFIFTFETSPLANKHVSILAINADEAILYVMSKVGNNWGICYVEKDFKNVDSKEVKLQEIVEILEIK